MLSQAARDECELAVGSAVSPADGAIMPAGAATVEPEKAYATAVLSSIHAFVTVDCKGVITSWSPGAETMFGYSAREVIGQPIGLIIPPDDEARITGFRSTIHLGNQVQTYEAVRITKDGRRLDVVVTLSPIRAPSGDVVGICSILSDISNQRRAEQLFGVVVEACPNGMILSDDEGRIVLINSAITRLFGYRRDELLGRSIDCLLPARARDRHADLRSEFMRQPDGGRAGHGRVMEAQRKDGTEIGVEVGLNLVTLDGRNMVLSVVSDARERLRVERMKNEFIATVSHELRTPLTSITGSLGLLLGGAVGPQDARVNHLLSIAHENSLRLVRLINDILDIAKIESGEAVFDFRATDVRPLVEQAIDGIRGFAEQFGVQVRLEADDATCVANVDADRIIQVVTNLVSNACKFSTPGSEVEVRTERRGALVRVSVRDHGPGIPPEFKSRVFGKFAQVDGSSTRKKGGTGLGLNIVRQLVTQHGGTVAFDAAPGGGTIFFVDLPTVASSPGPAAAGGQRQRAMFCSGDLDTSSTLCALFAPCGFPVDVVPTGSAALGHAAASRYAFFVIDLPIGDMDGVSLIRHLRADPRHAETPIIVIASGPGPCNADLRYDDQGIVAWLEKPVDPAHFANILDRVKAGRGKPRVLHVEEDPATRELVARALKREFEVVPAASLHEAKEALRCGHFDASVLDLRLPDGLGVALLPQLHDDAGDDLPLVVHSSHEVEAAISARAGAIVAKRQGSITDVADALRRLVGSRERGRPKREST